MKNLASKLAQVLRQGRKMKYNNRTYQQRTKDALHILGLNHVQNEFNRDDVENKFNHLLTSLKKLSQPSKANKVPEALDYITRARNHLMHHRIARQEQTRRESNGRPLVGPREPVFRPGMREERLGSFIRPPNRRSGRENGPLLAPGAIFRPVPKRPTEVTLASKLNALKINKN